MFSAVIKRESSTTNAVELYVVDPVSNLGVIWLPLHILLLLLLLLSMLMIIMTVILSHFVGFISVAGASLHIRLHLKNHHDITNKSTFQFHYSGSREPGMMWSPSDIVNVFVDFWGLFFSEGCKTAAETERIWLQPLSVGDQTKAVLRKGWQTTVWLVLLNVHAEENITHRANSHSHMYNSCLL